MGLYVRYFKQLHPQAENDQSDRQTQFIINVNFPGREGRFKAGVNYRYADSHGFLVGSNYTYTFFRNDLARLAGWPLDEFHEELYNGYAASAWSATGGPFWELINFSDGLGTLGTEVCAKLANDFVEFQQAADEKGDHYFSLCYYQWRKAFEIASDGGAVAFSYIRNPEPLRVVKENQL